MRPLYLRFASQYSLIIAYKNLFVRGWSSRWTGAYDSIKARGIFGVGFLFMHHSYLSMSCPHCLWLARPGLAWPMVAVTGLCSHFFGHQQPSGFGRPWPSHQPYRPKKLGRGTNYSDSGGGDVDFHERRNKL